MKSKAMIEFSGGVNFYCSLGFTLAEILITLGIIGVVAAITIPGLIQNAKNRERQVQLQKAYSDWNQVATKFMDEHDETLGSYIRRNGGQPTMFELTKQFTTRTYSGTAWGDSYKRYTLDGTVVPGGQPCDDTSKYSEIQGQIFNIDIVQNPKFNGPRLCIDINGKDKPNTFGIDIFSFIFTTDGHVIPEGQPHPDNDYNPGGWSVGATVKASADNCKAGSSVINTLGCTYFAINDKSPTGHGSYWKDFIGKKQYKK